MDAGFFLTDTGVNIQDFKAATKKLILATPVDKNDQLYEHHPLLS